MITAAGLMVNTRVLKRRNAIFMTSHLLEVPVVAFWFGQREPSAPPLKDR
jgi:hypothetical protein